MRDLHDGAQQRLVHAIVTLKLAQRALRDDASRAESLVAEALEHAERGNAELRELSHGILPSVLTRGGLHAGIDAVISRLEIPVDMNVTSERVAPEIDASAYFIVLEALANVVKHSRATSAAVTVAVDHDTLSVEVLCSTTESAGQTRAAMARGDKRPRGRIRRVASYRQLTRPRHQAGGGAAPVGLALRRP